MSGILSQQEIDTLLTDMGGGDDEAQDTREVVPFDFRLPHRLSKRELQTFYGVHETFAETFGSHLVSRLQTPVSMKVIGVNQQFYSQYVASTAKPSCLYVFRIGNSSSRAVMDLSPSLVLAIIALLLGGTVGGEIEPRTITRIEQNISKGLILRAISDLEKSWKGIIDQAFTLERYETEGDFVQIAPASEIVLVIVFELAIGELKYTMNVCFPTLILEDVIAKLQDQGGESAAVQSEQREWQIALFKKLESTKIQATCVLGDTSLTIQQLLDLEPGDVLVTNTAITGELNIVLGGKTRARGRPGISNGRAAVKVTQVLTDINMSEE